MPEIQPFRGIRYDLGHVGSLADVIAPPYDVISPEFQDELYERHPNNVVRLILNKIVPGVDDESDNRYTRAAKLMKQWQSEGVLMTEGDPAIYVYHQQFDWAGTTYVRRGFMARMRISPFGEGQVFPHEETLSGPKMDRLMLTTTCKANLSQIFGLYPDEKNETQQILEDAIAGVAPIEVTDHLGVIHRMWPVTDIDVATAVNEMMGQRPVFVADGHHRYETACNYRQQQIESGLLSPTHAFNFVLTHLVAMDDPGLAVLPTHRLFTFAEDFNPTSAELIERLGDNFTTRDGGAGPAQATELWEDIETGDDQGTVALYCKADDRWIIATLTDTGRELMAKIANDHNEEWQGLGVSVLHRLIMDELLGQKDLPKPKYVHLVEEIIEGCESGEFPMAALVMPATVDHIRKISISGERMPAKSTYFYPKLLSGLVINPLE